MTDEEKLNEWWAARVAERQQPEWCSCAWRVLPPPPCEADGCECTPTAAAAEAAGMLGYVVCQACIGREMDAARERNVEWPDRARRSSGAAMTDLDRLERIVDAASESPRNAVLAAALRAVAPDLIAVARQVVEPVPHGPALECQMCGRVWVPGAQAEHHWDDCSVGSLRARLAEVLR